MQGRIVVSGEGKLRTFDYPRMTAGRETTLASCGALCAGRDSLFAASDEENAVYRLDAASFLPRGVYAGGPGMRALCLSEDESRLLALLSDADSVLMLSGCDGAPMLLARVGVNPQNMRLDDTGRFLVVAGGEDGCAYLLCSRTLRLLERYPSRGVCCDALYAGDTMYALLLTGTLSSRLVSFKAGSRATINLPGPPGSLWMTGREVFAAAGEDVYAVLDNGARVHRVRTLFSRAGRVISAMGALFMLDPLSETLRVSEADAQEERILCCGVRDALVLENKGITGNAYSH